MRFCFIAIMLCFSFSYVSSSFALTLKPFGGIQLRTKQYPKLGGLSGLFFDQNTETLVLISDDSTEDFPRSYQLSLEFLKGRVEVKIDSKRNFSIENEPLPLGSVDLEGISKSKEGDFFLASEGRKDNSERTPSKILVATQEGKIINSIPLPSKFSPAPLSLQLDQKSGITPNRGIESLTVSPSGDDLFVGTENALFQDQKQGDCHSRGRSRILKYRVALLGEESPQEFIYQTDTVENLDMCLNFGLVELLALDEFHFLALERGVTLKPPWVSTRIYKVSIAEASNVSHLNSVVNHSFKEASKELVYEMQGSFPDDILDNYEGMAFGPKLPSGNRTIVLVSDDNFKKFHKDQKSMLIFFEVEDN